MDANIHETMPRKTEDKKIVFVHVDRPSVNQQVHFGTYFSIFSNQTVDGVDVALRSDDQTCASVHDGLAATTASHNLTIDSNTERET